MAKRSMRKIASIRSNRWIVLAGTAIFMFAISRLPAQITDAAVASLGDQVDLVSAPIDEGPGFAGLIARLTFALAAVFGLIFLASWLARKYMPGQIAGGGRGPIEVISTRSVGPRKSLMLVRIQDKTILLGMTAQNLQFLTEVDQGHGGWEEAAVQAGLEPIAESVAAWRRKQGCLLYQKIVLNTGI